LISCSRTQGSC